MSRPHQWLIERIRGEAADLDQVVERTRRGWSLAHKASVEQYAYVDSVALNLHSFYSGLEKIFELIARHVDQTLPKGDTWHRDLLQQMHKMFPAEDLLLSVKKVCPRSTNLDVSGIWCGMRIR